MSGALAVKTGIASNSENGVVSAAAELEPAVIADLLGWLRDVPASWVALDPTLGPSLIDAGCSPENAAWELEAPIGDLEPPSHRVRAVRSDADLEEWLTIVRDCGWYEALARNPPHTTRHPRPSPGSCSRTPARHRSSAGRAAKAGRPGYRENMRSPLWVTRVARDASTVLVDARPQALPSLAAVDGRGIYKPEISIKPGRRPFSREQRVEGVRADERAAGRQ
jgi:hypothetical protein